MIIILEIKCCGFTGHRKIPESQIENIRCRIRGEILLAIIDGYTHVLSGDAFGADLEFVRIILKVKEIMPHITLEAVLPYIERNDENDTVQELIKKCDKISIISEKDNKNHYFLRNSYLVEKSSRIIAVFNGNKRSGTSQTVRLASENKLDIKLIDIKSKEL
jgi:uncharacterized phage-like protein YoqJ